ncbi:MAG: ABC transporter ATP-binding protein [Chitinophagaceae bacterium]
MHPNMDFLSVSGLHQRHQDLPVLRDITFTVGQFQHTAIMGETGSGKSSLLKILAGWVSPVAGEVYFMGDRLLRIPEEKLIPGHKGIAWLSQQSDLPGFLTVAQVLEYANELPPDESAAIYSICDIVHLLKRRTDQLSGGEKQRIAIARLLTMRPTLLLLDEPFSNLDTIHKDTLKKVLKEIGDQLGVTCVMVAHDPQDTLSWARQVIVIRNGKILQSGSPREVYFSPVDEYTAALGGAFNYIPAAQCENFLNLWGYEHIKADLILRPENLTVTDHEDDPFFTVEESRFYGPYFLLLTVRDGYRLQVMLNKCSFQPGDRIRLHLEPADLHFMSRIITG